MLRSSNSGPLSMGDFMPGDHLHLPQKRECFRHAVILDESTSRIPLTLKMNYCYESGVTTAPYIF